MSKKTKINTDDQDVFRDAMIGTRRYEHKKATRAPTAKPVKRRPHTPVDADSDHLAVDLDIPAVTSEQIISFKHPSIPEKTLRKLRKGQYNVDAVLDLHGLTVAVAKVEVVRFIQICMHDLARVVLIIHGKGTHGREPTLKNRINNWLRNMADVLAFCSATRPHGGQGAVYVLLKQQNSGESD